jgi:AcrR family transcriptional regulator
VTSPRRLRADARENHDRVLEAAATLFAATGADTSLKAIARRAGVGIATLYRRFPTRESLIEAVYRAETARLAESAQDLLAGMPADEALRCWFEAFLDYMATKNGMAEALPAILGAQDDLRMHSRDDLRDAIAGLLSAGAQAGVLRPGPDPDDVMMSIGGIALITAHERRRELGSRLVDLLMHALVTGGRD